MVATLFLTLYLGFGGDLQLPSDDDPLKLNDEIKQFLDTHIDRSLESLQKLQALVRIIFEENALHFKYAPVTRTAIETYSNHGGNCISFTYLFIAMARHLGLKTHFREVDIVPLFSRVGNVVNVSGHANAAVFVGSHGYVVDLSPQLNRIELGGRIVSDERAVAHYFNNLGVDHLSNNRLEAAISSFRKALERDPTMTCVWANLGVAHAQVGDLKEAEKSYLKALQLDPREVAAMSNLVSLYERLGRSRDARYYMARVRKFQQKNPYYHFDLGLRAYQSGQYRESVEHYRTALKLKSVEHNFYLALARAYLQMGEVGKATDSLRQAMKNAPDGASKLRYNEKLALLASMHHRT